MATLADKAVGDIVKLNVNGVATNFIVVHQGNPDTSIYDASCDGTWLLMQDIYELKTWHGSSRAITYNASDMHTYLNSTFISLLDEDIQLSIPSIKLPYHTISGWSETNHIGADGLECKVFLLSAKEAHIGVIVDAGAELDYFKDIPGSGSGTDGRIAYYNGTATIWWLRSVDQRSQSSYYVFRISTSGTYGSTYMNNASCGVRPALIMPSTMNVKSDGTITLKGAITGSANIDGIAKEIAGGYVNIGGTWKEVVGHYQHIGGIWVPEIIYTWKKYKTVGTGAVYGWQWRSDAYNMFYPASSDDFSTAILEYITSSDELFTATYRSITQMGIPGFELTSLDWGSSSIQECTMQDLVNGTISPTYIKPKSGGWTAENASIYNNFVCKYRKVETSTNSLGVRSTYVTGWAPVSASYYTSYEAGNYIEDVSSNDPTAYPENDVHTDGYWYIRQY